MNAKYLIGFEMKIESNADFEDEAKISFELIQEKRDFLMNYFDVKHMKFTEREEAYFYLTMNPIEVPLISTGTDKITKELIENFGDMYENFCCEFDCRGVYYSINPMYFTIKNQDLVVYRNLSNSVEVYRGIDDIMLGNHCSKICEKEIKECKDYYRICPMNDIDMETEEEMF